MHYAAEDGRGSVCVCVCVCNSVNSTKWLEWMSIVCMSQENDDGDVNEEVYSGRKTPTRHTTNARDEKLWQKMKI